MKKKVVQFCSFKSIYNDVLQKHLKADVNFCREFEIEKIYLDEIQKQVMVNSNNIGKVRKLWSCFKMLKYLNNKYPHNKKADVVNIQFVALEFLFLLPYLKKNYNKIVLSFWGSDLLRQGKIKLFFMKPLFDIADAISFETKNMRAIFNQISHKKYDNKIRIVRFGIDLLEIIDSVTKSDISVFAEKYGIDTSRKIVVIGYNRIKQQQHLDVIFSLKKAGITREDIFIVFPWTYGPLQNGYKEKLLEEIGTSYDVCFLEDFLTVSEVACLRCIGDIMVQVQTTDALSFSMLEAMYAGANIITGDWLPYNDLLDAGMKFETVSSPLDVGDKVKKIITSSSQNDMEIWNCNRRIIKKLSGWDENIRKWVQLYQ